MRNTEYFLVASQENIAEEPFNKKKRSRLHFTHQKRFIDSKKGSLEHVGK
jgi:hypothetical protein